MNVTLRVTVIILVAKIFNMKLDVVALRRSSIRDSIIKIQSRMEDGPVINFKNKLLSHILLSAGITHYTSPHSFESLGDCLKNLYTDCNCQAEEEKDGGTKYRRKDK